MVEKDFLEHELAVKTKYGLLVVATSMLAATREYIPFFLVGKRNYPDSQENVSAILSLVFT